VSELRPKRLYGTTEVDTADKASLKRERVDREVEIRILGQKAIR